MGYCGINTPKNWSFKGAGSTPGQLGRHPHHTTNCGILARIAAMVLNPAPRAVDAGTSTAPYLSFRGLVKALDELAETPLPQRLGPTSWPNRQLGSRVMQGLRYLGFVGPYGQPMLGLIGYVKDDAEHRTARLRTAVSSAYRWALELPPDTSMEELLTAFESYGNVHGEDRRRAANFLIQAARVLQLPFAFKPRRRGRPARAPQTPDLPTQKHGPTVTNKRIDRHFDTLLDLLEGADSENEVDHDLLDRVDRLVTKLVDQRRLDRYFDFLVAHARDRRGPNRRVLDSLDRLHSP